MGAKKFDHSARQGMSDEQWQRTKEKAKRDRARRAEWDKEVELEAPWLWWYCTRHDARRWYRTAQEQGWELPFLRALLDCMVMVTHRRVNGKMTSRFRLLLKAQRGDVVPAFEAWQQEWSA